MHPGEHDHCCYSNSNCFFVMKLRWLFMIDVCLLMKDFELCMKYQLFWIFMWEGWVYSRYEYDCTCICLLEQIWRVSMAIIFIMVNLSIDNSVSTSLDKPNIDIL